MSLRCIVAISLALAANALAAKPETSLKVEAGWGGNVREGTWTPIFLTITTGRFRNANIDITWPAGAYATAIHQTVTIGPQARTFQILVPVRGWYSEATILVSDADTQKLLARYPEEGADSGGFGMNYSRGDLLGITGSRTSLSTLSLVRQISTGWLDPSMAPDTALGFDSLQALFLNAPNLAPSRTSLNELNSRQQEAIAAWVYSGGVLILWPGDDGFPSTSPVVDILPGKIGLRNNLSLTSDELNRIGLPDRFKHLPAYELTPTADAVSIDLPLGGQKALLRRVGLGKVILSPIHLGELDTYNGDGAKRLWKPLLDSALGPELDPNKTLYTPWSGQNESTASSNLSDFLGDVPGAGMMGFEFIALALAGMMLIVGPLDWFVLKRLKRQPLTWFTTSVWIVMITTGAIFAGHVFKSGELDFKTVRTIDQVDDVTIASTDYVSLYSSRTRDYAFNVNPSAWWQPGDTGIRSYSSMKLDVNFHQTMNGNVPEDSLINIWSLRFLRGDSIAAGPAVLNAKIHLERDDNPTGFRIAGAITNQSDLPLKNVRILFAPSPQEQAVDESGTARPTRYWTQDCSFEGAHATTSPAVQVPISETVLPHSTAAIQFARLSGPSMGLADSGLTKISRNDSQETISRQMPGLAFDLNWRRTQLYDAMLRTGRYGLICAELSDAPPAATINAEAVGRHWRFVRAIVPLTR